VLCLGLGLLPTVAAAQRETTRDSLARLEETFALRLEEGGFNTQEFLPAIVVSAAPAFEETRAWYPAAAVATLARALGPDSLRACEACMAPRLHVDQGRLEQVTVSVSTQEIIRFDESTRGPAPPARAAIWLDETREGVALRVVDLRNNRILLADNFDPGLRARARTRTNFSLTRELDRRARGESITHTFFDVALYPGQHASLDFAEQWGDTNANLSGFSLSLFDPIVGVGGSYYRVVPRALNITVGGKILMSVPTALVRAISGEAVDVLDPLLTGVFVVRVPIATSNYAITFTASTNGQIGLGFSLMNSRMLPVLP
jgi:hypothetical protein